MERIIKREIEKQILEKANNPIKKRQKIMVFALIGLSILLFFSLFYNYNQYQNAVLIKQQFNQSNTLNNTLFNELIKCRIGVK